MRVWLRCPFIVGACSERYLAIKSCDNIGHDLKYPFCTAFNHLLLVGYPAHACKYSNLFLMLVISKTECADIVGGVSSVACVSGVMFVSGMVHNFVFGSRVPAHITLLCLVTDTLVAVNATVHSSLHNFPMEMSECLARPGNM